MFNNYLVLRKLTKETDALFREMDLMEVFTQEKNCLILTFRGTNDKSPVSPSLVISVNSVRPFVYWRDAYHRAKKNSIDFFTEYLPSRLKNISIADYERIIRVSFEKFDIYIVFRGPLSNVILINSAGEIITFKSETDENLITIIDSVESAVFNNYLPPIILPVGSGKETLRQTIPFFSKEIMAELVFRETPVNSGTANSMINEILSGNISVFRDANRKEIHLLPSSFSFIKHNNPDIEEVLLPSVNDAVRYYLNNLGKFNSFTSLYKKLDKFISTNLEQLSGKLNQQDLRISLPSREEEYNKLGNLLLINIGKFSRGDSSGIVEDVYNNNELLTVPLKITLSPQENARNYFDKARGEKISLEKYRKLKSVTIKRYDQFRELSDRLNNSSKYEELTEIKKESGMEEKEFTTEENELLSKFRHFILAGKYHVYVGKDSAANDLLTLRFARPNDLWFHARGYAGSHTLLKVENSKEGVPKEIIKRAASIAAFYSKGKTSKLVPVSYTFKKYVTKRKGLEAGQVMLTKEQVVMVKPEIPETQD